MKQSNIFKPTLKFSQKTSVSIFVHFVYDMYIVVDSLIGYEPADLTVHPPPRTAEGGFIYFV